MIRVATGHPRRDHSGYETSQYDAYAAVYGLVPPAVHSRPSTRRIVHSRNAGFLCATLVSYVWFHDAIAYTMSTLLRMPIKSWDHIRVRHPARVLNGRRRSSEPGCLYFVKTGYNGKRRKWSPRGLRDDGLGCLAAVFGRRKNERCGSICLSLVPEIMR